MYACVFDGRVQSMLYRSVWIPPVHFFSRGPRSPPSRSWHRSAALGCKRAPVSRGAVQWQTCCWQTLAHQRHGPQRRRAVGLIHQCGGDVGNRCSSRCPQVQGMLSYTRRSCCDDGPEAAFFVVRSVRKTAPPRLHGKHCNLSHRFHDAPCVMFARRTFLQPSAFPADLSPRFLVHPSQVFGDRRSQLQVAPLQNAKQCENSLRTHPLGHCRFYFCCFAERTLIIVHATNAKHLKFILDVPEYSGAPLAASEDCTAQGLVRLSRDFSGHVLRGPREP